MGENCQKDKMWICWCPAIFARERQLDVTGTCDVTSAKWGVTSLQLVRFSEAYKTDCSEATVWKRKTWSQFTKHNLFQALCYNKQSSSDFSNTQPVGSFAFMGGFFSFVQLNLSECKILYSQILGRCLTSHGIMKSRTERIVTYPQIQIFF